mgnify:FL=1
MRIAIGGFQHETNTFAPSKATWQDFVRGGGFPALTSGSELLTKVGSGNLPIAGFIQAATKQGHTLLPTTWCAATPSAHVTREAFENISKLILDGLRQALPVDAVYLDLHGAGVTEHYDDAEGELLRRVRDLVGPQMPIIASLDLHANITSLMAEQADTLVVYRTYPHIDMADTGARAFVEVQRRLDGAPRPKMALRRIPFLIPICWQTTDLEPAKGLYALIDQVESSSVPSASIATGFPAADFPGCSPVVLAYGLTQADADAAVGKLEAAFLAAETAFAGKTYTPDEAVMYASSVARNAARPVVIADSQDNPGAGGNSDTTGILKALVRHDAQRAAIGLIVDKQAAAAAHAAGVGATIRLALGGHSGIKDDSPLEAEFFVESLSDGIVPCFGPFKRGLTLRLGPIACLRIGSVRIVVSTNKTQMADQAMFRAVGIEPSEQAILVVKSSVHFRADFTSIAEEIIVCTSPGPMITDTTQQPWTNLQDGIRLAPHGPVFKRSH